MFENIIIKYAITIIISLIPIIELRGAIPIAVFSLHLTYMEAFILSVIGNCIPIYFIVKFIRPLFDFFGRFKFFKVIIDWATNKANKKRYIAEFKSLINKNRKYINPELINQILLDYGKMEEYEEFSSLLQDYKRVVVHHINQGQIEKALNYLSQTACFLTDAAKEYMDLLRSLGNIFLENSHYFFQNVPKSAFDFLNNILIKCNVDIDNYIESVILALMSRTDKDINKSKNKDILTEDETKFYIDEIIF